VPAGFDGVGDGLSGFLDRLSSRLNGLLGLVELVWAIDTFADHLGSPWQLRRPTPRNGESFPALVSSAKKSTIGESVAVL
jgi:hypothetical protein